MKPILSTLTERGYRVEVLPLASRPGAYRVRTYDEHARREPGPNEGTIRYSLDGAISEAARLIARDNPEVIAAANALDLARKVAQTNAEAALLEQLPDGLATDTLSLARP